MFRSIRTLIIAVVVAVSLLGSGSIASADQGPSRSSHRTPPAQLLDITWE